MRWADVSPRLPGVGLPGVDVRLRPGPAGRWPVSPTLGSAQTGIVQPTASATGSAKEITRAKARLPFLLFRLFAAFIAALLGVAASGMTVDDPGKLTRTKRSRVAYRPPDRITLPDRLVSSTATIAPSLHDASPILHRNAPHPTNENYKTISGRAP